MAVSQACLCTRDEVMLSLDFHPTARTITLVDRAIQSAVEDVHGLCHRKFIPEDATRSFDWPNFQSAYPWRIWLDADELASKANAVVTTGGVTIPSASILWRSAGGPGWDDKPPFTAIELNRSTMAAFGAGSTPQRDVVITGTYGGCAVATVAAGALAASVLAADTTITVTDGSQMGVGDLLVIGSERLVVADRAMVSTGVAFTGPSTAAASDNLIAVPDVTKFSQGEVLLLDTERMWISDIVAGKLVVKRAWDGTQLAAHTSGTIYASRLLSVVRGQLGTVAAGYSSAAPVARYTPPPLISELALAVAENIVLQKTSGYGQNVGEGQTLRAPSGAGLADIESRVYERYARKARTGVI